MHDTKNTLQRMGWTPPSAPLCPACSMAVYPAEAVMAVDRTPFHKQCVKCRMCRSLAALMSTS